MLGVLFFALLASAEPLFSNQTSTSNTQKNAATGRVPVTRTSSSRPAATTTPPIYPFGNKTYVDFIRSSFGNLDIPAKGTGSSYVSRCSEISIEYADILYDYVYRYERTSKESTLFTGQVTHVYTNYTYTGISTLCDGHPRIVGGITPTSTWTETWTQSSMRRKEFTDVVPRPNCFIEPEDCATLYSTFFATRTIGGSVPPRGPPCRTQNCDKCTIHGSVVEVLYSPVPTTVSRDMCATSNHGPLPTGPRDDAKPELVTFSGRTLDLRSAYISLKTASAVDFCGRTLGDIHTDIFVAVPSTALTTIGEYEGASPTRLDFADFNSPVPYTAYRDGNNPYEYCEAIRGILCPRNLHGPANATELRSRAAISTWVADLIVEEEFRPTLLPPFELRNMDPAWKNCQGPIVLYDPPIALPTVDSLVQTPAPSHLPPPPPVPPNPAPSAQDPRPVQTGGPVRPTAVPMQSGQSERPPADPNAFQPVDSSSGNAGLPGFVPADSGSNVPRPDGGSIPVYSGSNGGTINAGISNSGSSNAGSLAVGAQAQQAGSQNAGSSSSNDKQNLGLAKPGPVHTITVGSQTFTYQQVPSSQGNKVVLDGSVTIAPGSKATLRGVPIVFAENGQSLVAASSTITLQSEPTLLANNLDVIPSDAELASAHGGSPTTASTGTARLGSTAIGLPSKSGETPKPSLQRSMGTRVLVAENWMVYGLMLLMITVNTAMLL